MQALWQVLYVWSDLIFTKQTRKVAVSITPVLQIRKRGPEVHITPPSYTAT